MKTIIWPLILVYYNNGINQADYSLVRTTKDAQAYYQQQPPPPTKMLENRRSKNMCVGNDVDSRVWKDTSVQA